MQTPEYRQRVSEGTRRGQEAMTLAERESWNLNQSLARLGTHPSDATRSKLAEIALHNYRGGQTADVYASVLCPVGFIREYHFTYGTPIVKTLGRGLRRPRYQMDFAHLEGKINIELDGRGHKASAERDSKRDTILRELGWKVIRIKQ